MSNRTSTTAGVMADAENPKAPARASHRCDFLPRIVAVRPVAAGALCGKQACVGAGEDRRWIDAVDGRLRDAGAARDLELAAVGEAHGQGGDVRAQRLDACG